MKKLVVLLFLMPVLLSSLNVDVSVNKYNIGMDDHLQLTLKVSDSQRLYVSEPQPPQIPLFSFRNMTSASQRTTSMAGLKVASEFSQVYTYIYIPQKTGKTTIPSFKVKVNNREYSTRTIEINIVKGAAPQPRQSAPPNPFADPFGFDVPDPFSTRTYDTGNTFLLALPEKQTVYRGFPAVVSYYLYTDEMVRSFNLDDEIDYSGYGKSTYEQPSMLNYEDTTLNGKSFKCALIKRLALMPNQDGVLQAPKMQGSARLYNFGYLNKPLTSVNAEIVVKPLPRDNVPTGFNGAVGNFKLSHNILDTEITLGEALTLSLKIQGRGNFNQFTAPRFTNEDGFQISSPMVVDNLQSGIDGTRTYYYTIIPQRKGEQTLPELRFVWFGNDVGEYRIYTVTPIKVNVKPAHVLSYLNRLWEQNLPTEMQPKIVRKSFKPYRLVAGQAWYWFTIVLLLSLFAIVTLIALDRKLQQRNPQAYAKKKAEKILHKYMKQSIEAAQNLSPEFYPLAEKALFNYLDSKYKLPNRLSNQEKIAELVQREIPGILVDDINRFLSHCQAARFMPEADRAVNLQADSALLKGIVSAFSKLRSVKKSITQAQSLYEDR